MRCIEARAVRAGPRIRFASEHRQRAPGIALRTRRVGDVHHRPLSGGLVGRGMTWPFAHSR